MKSEREVPFSDLLNRQLFRLPDAAAQKVAGKTILITGGAGSIGSELLRRLRELDPATIVAFDNAEDRLYRLHCELQRSGSGGVELVLGDVTSPRELEWVLEKYSPRLVFHAAAYKHVDFLETQILAAVRTNVFGTRNVLTKCQSAGVETIVVLSSDKATNPVSVLGATKRVSELLVTESGGRSDISAVRLCNVLGSAGSLMPLVLEQTKAGVVRITDNAAERYFISPDEAAELLLSAASVREQGVLIPMCASRLNIRELASRIVEEMGPGLAQVRMEIVGLRPGERLSEELYQSSELVIPSDAPGLLKATATNHVSVDDGLRELEDAFSTRDEGLVIESLMNLVPDYRPSQKVSIPLSQ